MCNLARKLLNAEQLTAQKVCAQRLERLREQRVSRPRLLFSFAVSSSTGQGLEELRRGLSALMRDRRLFPHVGMKVPLNYSMLQRLAQDGRRVAGQTTRKTQTLRRIGDDQSKTPTLRRTRAGWRRRR